jgi:hypothetical protein
LDQRLINVEDIIYVRHQVSDLDVMERFLIDFSLLRASRTKTTLYMRGTGEAVYLHVSELGSDGREGANACGCVTRWASRSPFIRD